MKVVQVDNFELQLDQMKFIVFKEDDKMFYANESEGFYKNDCTVLQSDTQPEPSSKAILDNSPKLIAKAGEWVKPTYFDKCSIMTNNNGCGLVLNDPVLLHQDLYSDSTKIYIESRYGIQHNESDLGKTRFELCPAPVSEPVQVDTPIERIGVGVEDIIKYIENDAEIAIPINDFFNEDGSHITKKQYGHILLKYLCIELREKFSITKPIE